MSRFTELTNGNLTLKHHSCPSLIEIIVREKYDEERSHSLLIDYSEIKPLIELLREAEGDPINGSGWIKASDGLPKEKMWYNCKLNGLPIALFIDPEKERIWDGKVTEFSKNSWKHISILVENNAYLSFNSEDLKDRIYEIISNNSIKSEGRFYLPNCDFEKVCSEIESMYASLNK